MKKNAVVLECVLNAPVERVWKALTDKDLMKEWILICLTENI